MTNKDRQARLDTEKWLCGEFVKHDPSGYMVWCGHCEYQVVDMDNYCTITHEERVEKCLCAKAYNRMVRGTKK